MTKVQLEYELARPLDDKLMDRIAAAHGVYGLTHIALSPSLDRLRVEYDASRLTATDVEACLHALGIPVVLSV